MLGLRTPKEKPYPPVKELGRRLHRDPSMISRLYTGYVATRTGSWEKQVQAILKKYVNTHARPHPCTH